jgi:CubicO group peptidase (beta-lactamase class C family)
MHRFLRGLILLAVTPLSLLGHPCFIEGQAFPPDSGLLALIQGRVEEGRATGIVVGVREADGTHRIVAYGDPGPGALPLDGESVFEIGSITKVFTGILLAEMAASGEVSLEDQVQDHVPPEVTIPSRNGGQIRLVDLATHRSGLPRLPDNMDPAEATNPYADYTVAQLHEFLSGHTLRRDIGAEFEYSNLGTGLLGQVLAGVNSSDWESLVKESLLEPLGMEMSGVTLSPEMREHLALGHNPAGEVVPNWDIPTFAGAGALRSNAEDMLVFLDANLGEPKGLLEEAMRVSHEPRLPAGSGMRIGLNWITRTSGEGTIVWHNGGTGGYRSFLGFDPVREVGVVVLTNSSQSADDIGFHLLNSAIPLADPPTPPVERDEIEVGTELLEEYVGLYELTPSFQIEVTLEGGGLHVQATGQPRFPIFAETETRFFLKVVNAQVTFVRSEAGEVTELILHQGGLDQTAQRVR